MSEEWGRLQAQLRAEPPAGMRALSGDQMRHLADAIAAARHRQAEALNRAGEEAFGYVPRLLRGPIRRILR